MPRHTTLKITAQYNYGTAKDSSCGFLSRGPQLRRGGAHAAVSPSIASGSNPAIGLHYIRSTARGPEGSNCVPTLEQRKQRSTATHLPPDAFSGNIATCTPMINFSGSIRRTCQAKNEALLYCMAKLLFAFFACCHLAWITT